MKKEYSDFLGNDTLALQYIKDRGYASFSSLRNVRDKLEPSKGSPDYFLFGSELHSMFLENGKRKNELSEGEEKKLKNMISALHSNKLVRTIMATSGMKTEVEFRTPILGLPMLGYIDIDAPKFVADLKSTHLSRLPEFVKAMDFMQAAIYLRMRPQAKSFYYLGICKNPPFRVMTFDARDYAIRLRDADDQLITTINYVKEKTGLGSGESRPSRNRKAPRG